MEREVRTVAQLSVRSPDVAARARVCDVGCEHCTRVSLLVTPAVAHGLADSRRNITSYQNRRSIFWPKLHSSDFAVNRLCTKLFKTGSIDVVEDCQSMLR